ncbi:hypothetical protein WMF18_26505 [Sorangium sp. So ce315]|uniref:hypothetical protein n=1 Tax=Sorangium sp. So ce315 TaxID=3133299 RepID=UPI003F621D06
MMAYTLLVGVPYWQPEASSADGVFAFAMVAAPGPEEPPVQRARSQGVVLPQGFDAWFARAAAPDPAARFRRAMEAVQALGEVLGVPVGGGRGIRAVVRPLCDQTPRALRTDEVPDLSPREHRCQHGSTPEDHAFPPCRLHAQLGLPILPVSALVAPSLC